MTALLACEAVTAAPWSSTVVISDGDAARQMWCAVLARTIADARGEVEARDAGEIARARSYLSRGGEDFRTVCWLAGHDPEVVQARLRRDGVIPAAAEVAAGEEAAGKEGADRDLGAIAAVVLDRITQAAAEGRPCPTNQEIARLGGWTSLGSASHMVARLVAQGHITVERIGQSARIVTVLATGQRTARP